MKYFGALLLICIIGVFFAGCVSNQENSTLEKGKTLAEEGRYDEAIQNLDKALAITPNDTALLVLKGGALTNLGNYNAALEAYDSALSIRPDLAEAWSGRGYALEAGGRI